MSFLKLHKLCSYLLAFTGLLPLLLSEELHPATWFVAILGFGWSWRVEAATMRDEKYRKRWTWGVVVGLFCAAFLAFSGIFPNPILLGAYLLLLLQLNKLFNRSESKDYLHIYLLSFLMLTLGTIINTDFSYALCFVLYVVFLTWTLTLFHLRREIENTYITRHEEEESEDEVDIEKILHSRRLIKGSFLLSTSLIALLVFSLSGLMFLLFPRIGFGLFFQRKRRGLSMSGFSNKVRLGSMRRIQLNRKVVLRVEFPDARTTPKRLRHYWRGMAYDQYDGESWKQSRRMRSPVRFSSPSRYIISSIPLRLRKRVVRHVIYQEPLNTSVLFGIDRIFNVKISISIPEMVRRQIPRIQRDRLSDTLTLRRFNAEGSSVRYTVFSVPGESYPLHVRHRTAVRSQELFLQLPKSFNPRIRALAERVTRKATTVFSKAKALESFLSTQYSYSLSRKDFTGPPLDNFLFEQKVGHCEFFATAFVIMLRSIGIHARQVSGFMGGDWNAYGKYYAVRQSHAHAWAEVFLPRKGWTRFDPSPRSAPSNFQGLLSSVEAYWDSLRLRWHKWVIEYDLIHQIQAVKAIYKNWFKQTSSPIHRENTRSTLSINWKHPVVGLIWIILLAAGIVIAWIARRKQNVQSIELLKVSQLYIEANALLKPHNLARHAHETPDEHVLRIQDLHPAYAKAFAPIARVYLALRYDPKSHIEHSTTELLSLMEHLKTALEQEKGVPS